MDLAELEALLTELRHIRTDHQGVEAKRAGKALPATTHETLSAFANTDGGLLLLGVDEGAGGFDVTGVADAKQSLSDLQALCALMEPPLRATVDLIAHPDGVVLAAYVPAVPRTQRPCHRAHDGPVSASYIRVGDGDQKMTSAEVAQMLANRSGHDFSAAEAPEGSELDAGQAASFVHTLRASNRRYSAVPAELLLQQFGASLANDGRPTYAGLLMLGNVPQQRCAAARVTYRRLPRRGDPPATRFAGKHLEGTVGELLDDSLSALAEHLDPVQVVRAGAVYDELDVPREALREVMSNALIHRSLTPDQRDTSVLVEVSDEAVVITSPGGLHVSADPATLGLAPMTGVRNLSMVRLGEQLRTPSGGRIVEHQTSGIAAADRACHAGGTVPVLFVDQPSTFQAVMLRGAVDVDDAEQRLRGAGLAGTPNQARLVAVLSRLDEVRPNITATGLGAVVFDARLAARALAPMSVEDAAAELRVLEDGGALRRTHTRKMPVWVLAEKMTAIAATQKPSPEPGAGPATRPAPEPAKRKPGRQQPNRVPELLAAIAAAPDGVLSAKGIEQALGLSSPTSRSRWIGRAAENGLIESTVANPFDPTGGYRLTAQGRAHVEAGRP